MRPRRPTTTTTLRSAPSPKSKPPTAQPSSFPNSTTGHVTAERAGTVRFSLVGNPVSLSMFWLLDYAGGFFLSYRDATSGGETYGAGRYLLDTAKGADLGADASGRLLLDFNFAYQPSCSYDPRWSCPLPPRENWLDDADSGRRTHPHLIRTGRESPPR